MYVRIHSIIDHTKYHMCSVIWMLLQVKRVVSKHAHDGNREGRWGRRERRDFPEYEISGIDS